VAAADIDGGPVEAYLAAIHPDDVARVQARIAHALASGDAFSDSYRVRGADGCWRHVEARGKVSLGADGRAEWLPGVVVDVTAQKEAEAGLRRSEARFRRLAESNVLGIVQYRFDGALVEVNDAFLDILQVTRADYERSGLSWRDLTPPEWREADERGWDQLRTTGVMEPYEKEYLRSDGSRAVVYLGAANVEGSADEGIAYVLDISGIRGAERALKESEARFRVIANAMPQAVWSTRPDGFHDYYNDQWYAFTGTPHSRSRVMPRSCKPSSSHLSAIEVTSSGHWPFLPSIHSRSRSENRLWRRNRCLESRISMSSEPEIAERGLIRSAGSSTRVQFSHWSPRALS